MSQLTSHILFAKYKKVQALCKPLAKLGIVGFIYIRRYNDGRFIDLSNQIEWTDFFLNKYLHEEYSAGVVEDHMLSEGGVSFWCTEPDNLIWQEGAEVFGFGNGISIYSHKEHYCEIFCFYGKKEDHFLNKFFMQSFPLLEKFAHYFRENIQPDILESYEKQDFLYTPSKYLHSKTNVLLKEEEKAFLHEISMKDKKDVLSVREQECVMLGASGKTAKETAQVLQISPRTVEVHIAHAKEKLGCKNFKELCSILSVKKLFSF